MTETVEVTITVPKLYMDFLNYLLDDNPEDNMASYFDRLLTSDIENMLIDPVQLGEYLVPKIRAMFPGLPE